MSGKERRNAIFHYLCQTKKPVAGTTLAHEFGVSRQVIVQDIALLRSTNVEIISTNRGYLIGQTKVLPPIHSDSEGFSEKKTALKTGIKGSRSVVTDETNSAKAMGSGTLNVFATPAMIALMEETAWKSVTPYLEEGQGTVGIRLEISHMAPTPLGMTVLCESELIEIDGRRLIFEVSATDGKDIIGRGRHERFLVTNEKFQKKADAKR